MLPRHANAMLDDDDDDDDDDEDDDDDDDDDDDHDDDDENNNELFCGMVDRRKASSPSRISDTTRA